MVRVNKFNQHARFSRKVSLPHMGDYANIIAGVLRQDLGWDVILPPPNNQSGLSRGASQLHELICLPAKMTLGNMIQSAEQGATELLMFTHCGQCRLKSYYLLQQQALTRMGYQVKVYPIELGLVSTPSSLRSVDPSISWVRAFIALAHTVQAIVRHEQRQPTTGTPPQIGVVGEIFTMCDSFTNCDLIKKLRGMGCFVHTSLSLSYFALKHLYRRRWRKRRDMDMTALKKAQYLARSVFPKDVGGHGSESIAHTIYYGLMGFDAVVHVAPFPCQPESTVASIVDEMAHRYGMATLRLIFDQHTADTGLVTRLEAFVDMLRRKRYP